MGNQNQNGRNVALPDENRPSWRPQDQSVRGRGDDEDRGRSWRDRDDRDDDRLMSDRGRYESRWDEDRDEGYRTSERYGQGQSGYAAGRQADDRSMQGYQNRNQSYAGGYEDRQHGAHLDDRFSGRGGQGYWQDRGNINPDRQYGGGRGDSDRGVQGYNSGYNQNGLQGVYGSQGSMGGGQGGFGGYGSSDAGSMSGQGFGAQGLGQGRTGGYAPQSGPYGGRSGAYGQGHQGMEYGYGSQGSMVGGQQGYGGSQSGQSGSSWNAGPEPQRQQRGLHRGKGPQGYQRSDERIRELVCEALTDDDQIDASTIEIAVKSGEVILSGTVPDRQTKRMAEDVVERCAGVKDVQNQIKVSDSQSSRGSGSHTSKSETETPSSDKKHRA